MLSLPPAFVLSQDQTLKLTWRYPEQNQSALHFHVVKQGKCLAYQRCSRTSVSQRNAACASLSLSSLSTMSKSAHLDPRPEPAEKIPVRETFVSEPLGSGGRVLRVHRTCVKALFRSFLSGQIPKSGQWFNPKLGLYGRRRPGPRRRTRPDRRPLEK